MCPAILSWLHTVCLLCVICVAATSDLPYRGSSFFEDDTPIHTEYVDRNNRTILAMFNLTEAQMSSLATDNNAKNKNATGQQRTNEYFNQIKESRLNDIRIRLANAFKKNNSEDSQEHPLHEMAAYPICSADSDESSWMRDNNVTIRFSDTLFEPKRDNLNLDSAILRLYKVKPDGSAGEETADETEAEAATNSGNSPRKMKRCTDPLWEAQIRVTVSIVQQLRRNKRSERKKRICNSIMMNVSKTGWVEIDIKRAIHIWENVERMHHQQHHQQQQQQQQQQQPGGGGRLPILVGWLMIEVHDEEERPLKPGLFFKPPKCDEADLAIPWNYYRSDSALSPYAANEVPRYPRLDVKLIGYASFAPKTSDKEFYDRLRNVLQHQLHTNHKQNATPSTLNEMDIESATTTNQYEASSDPASDNSLLHADQLLANDLSQQVQQQQQHQQPHNQRKDHYRIRRHQHRLHQRQQHQNHHRNHQHKHRLHKSAQL